MRELRGQFAEGQRLEKEIEDRLTVTGVCQDGHG